MICQKVNSVGRIASYSAALTAGTVGLLTVFTPRVAQAQIIVDPTFLSGTNLNTDTSLGFAPANLTTDAGMSSGVDTGNTLTSAQSVTFTGSNSQQWGTASSGPNYYSGNSAPVFVFDLGQNYSVSNAILWQYNLPGNGNQANLFQLRFSSAAAGPTFAGAYTSNTLLPNTSAAQTYALSNPTARYVELTLASNYYGSSSVGGGGDRVGLGKIRFAFNSAAAPEPSALLILAPGALTAGLVGIGRRRKAAA